MCFLAAIRLLALSLLRGHCKIPIMIFLAKPLTESEKENGSSGVPNSVKMAVYE